MGLKLAYKSRPYVKSGAYRRSVARVKGGRSWEIKARISDYEKEQLTKWRQSRGLTVSQAIRAMLHKQIQFGAMGHDKIVWER